MIGEPISVLTWPNSASSIFPAWQSLTWNLRFWHFLAVRYSLFWSCRTFSLELLVFMTFSHTPLLSRIRFRLLLIRFFFTCLVISRVSPVPGHTFHTYRSPYTGGFSLVLFQFLPNFHGLRPIGQGSTSSFLLFWEKFYLRYGRIHFMLRSAWLLALLMKLHYPSA